jgi:type IV pilus assembly protein PilM
MFNPFKIFLPKKMIGIDIGTSSVKIVEISRWGEGRTLENYGYISSESFYANKAGNEGNEGTSILSNEFIAKVIRGILDEAKIKSKAAIFSIPDFSTFCTSFDIPPMPEKEIPNAVYYNASQYITLPISEVALDWKVAPVDPSNKNSMLRVFLIAIPNQVIQDYKHIAFAAGLQLYAIEGEALADVRSLVKNNKKSVCLIDIGMQSSVISVVDKGFLKRSYSFNFNAGKLSHVVATTLGVDQQQAEKIIRKDGLMHPRQDIVKTLFLLLDPLLSEIKGVCAEYLQLEQRQVEQIYLTGGPANLPGLKEYFSDSLKKEVLVPNCFADFLYSPILEKTLKDMAPSFSGAIGVALRGLET